MDGSDDASSVKDGPSASFLYFDGTSNCGFHNGIVNVTIVANRFLPQKAGGVGTVAVAVSHLRCSVAAAIDLRDALDKAILISANAPSAFSN